MIFKAVFFVSQKSSIVDGAAIQPPRSPKNLLFIMDYPFVHLNGDNNTPPTISETPPDEALMSLPQYVRHQIPV